MMNTLRVFSRIPLGVRFIIMSAFGFAVMGVLVKSLGMQGIPILQIVAARAVVSLILSYGDVRRKKIPVWGKRKGLLCARAIVGTIALMLVYYSVVNLPLAEATVLQYLHPMFTAFLAVIFLKESLKLPIVICILLSFVGLLLIVRPAFLFGGLSADYELVAIIAAVLGAFGSAVGYVFVRKLNETEDSSVIIFYFPLFALPVSLVLLGGDIIMPQGIQWLMLLLVGVMTQVGQVGLTRAMQTETASRATSFSYLQIIFSIMLGWLLFAELPSIWVYIGAILIVIGAVINIMFSASVKTVSSKLR